MKTITFISRILPESKILWKKERVLDSEEATVIFVCLTGITAAQEQEYDKTVLRPEEIDKPFMDDKHGQRNQ